MKKKEGRKRGENKRENSPGKLSRKITHPKIAVIIKFALVFITLTRTVLDARRSALVNKPHMMALKRRLRRKKNYSIFVIQNCGILTRKKMTEMKKELTPLTNPSTIITNFPPSSSPPPPRAVEMAVAQVLVNWVVVSLANTPLRAAQKPEERA